METETSPTNSINLNTELDEEFEDTIKLPAVTEELENVSSRAALAAWENGYDVYINNKPIEKAKEIYVADDATTFSISKEAMETYDVKEAIAKDERIARAEESRTLNFLFAEVERYGVTDKDCYTLHPHEDLMEELYARVQRVDISFSSVSFEKTMQTIAECEFYASLNAEMSEAELHFCQLTQGKNVVVPLNEEEQHSLITAVQTYESNREQAEATKKESPSVSQEKNKSESITK